MKAFAPLALLLALASAIPSTAQNTWNGSSVSTFTTNGKVGIGVLNPTDRLQLLGGLQVNGQIDQNKSSFFGYNESGNFTYVTSFDKGTGTFQNLFLSARHVGIGTASPATELDVVGTTRTSVLEITGGSDLAEPFYVAGGPDVRPGTVLAIDPAHPGRLRVADRAYDKTVAGIVSGAGGVRPGMLMLQEGTVADGRHPVALSGRVFALADTSSGPIEPGDLLTTSARPGHAMKVTDPARAQGAILGKAMTPLADGEGLVLVLVALQ